MKAVAAFAPVLLLSGCVLVNGPPDTHMACATGLKPMLTAELFFGRDIEGQGQVGDAAWQDFVAQEIAPRFPDGFTVGDAAGQWREAGGAVVREKSKRVTIVLAEGGQQRLAAIRDAYKRRFHQESVLLVETQACAAF